MWKTSSDDNREEYLGILIDCKIICGSNCIFLEKGILIFARVHSEIPYNSSDSLTGILWALVVNAI